VTTLPKVGDVVHYRSHGTPGGEYTPACRAAIVTEVYNRGPEETAVGLCVLNPTGQFFNPYICRAEPDYLGGTWHDRGTCETREAQ